MTAAQINALWQAAYCDLLAALDLPCDTWGLAMERRGAVVVALQAMLEVAKRTPTFEEGVEVVVPDLWGKL